MISRTERLPQDTLAPLAAMDQFDGLQATAFERTGLVMGEVSTRLEEARALTELTQTVYVNAFMRDTEVAAQAALDLAHGTGELDLASFGPDATEQQVREYLAPFGIQDPSVKYPFPRLWLPATAVIPFRGRAYTFDPHGYYSPLTPYMLGPSFRPDIQLPQLIDPQPRTFAEFKELSQLDPGHADQVFEAYRMAAHEQAEAHQGVHFKDPVIIRAVATLPVSDQYMTDFLPRIELEDPNTVWDPRLLVGGALNPSGNYLYTQVHIARDRVIYAVDGKEAALRVTRPKPGERESERDLSPVGLADHEYHSMAVILFPYHVQKAPRRSSAALGALPFSGPAMLSFNSGPERSAIGDANIGTGSVGHFTASKRDIDLVNGDRMVPIPGGQPLIYSIRLFTASSS